ncbi:MAG: AraC family transcriptional regulator [Ruthenibacterium sp.]
MSKEYEVIEHKQIGGLNMFVVNVEYRTPHLHRDFEFNLIIEGNASFLCGNNTFEVHSGDLLVLNPNQLHEIRSDTNGVTLLCLQIHPNYYNQIIPAFETIQFDAMPFSKIDTKKRAEINQVLIQLANCYVKQPPYFEVECSANLHSLLTLMLRETEHHQLSDTELHSFHQKTERLLRLLDFVDNNYSHKIRLSDFAAQEKLDMSYVSHFIKDNLNQNFQDYVMAVRYNQARKLILSTNRSLYDISYESGFSDMRYLKQAFQLHAGVSPETFKKKKRIQIEGEIHHSIHSSQHYFSPSHTLEKLNRYSKLHKIYSSN